VQRIALNAASGKGSASLSATNDDHVVLWRVVHVHLFDLPDRMRNDVDLNVIEPDSFVFICRLRKGAVVALVAIISPLVPFESVPAVHHLVVAAHEAAADRSVRSAWRA
jgi:hypothetical protein